MPEATHTSRSPLSLDETALERSERLRASEISLLVLLIVSVVISRAMPFPWVKLLLIAVLGIVTLVQTMHRPAVGLALLAFATPAIEIIPVNELGIRGLNAETLMVVVAIFIWARATQRDGRDRISAPLAPVLMIYAGLIIASAFTAWVVWGDSLFDVLAAAKNHLSFLVFFPVAFHVGRTRRDQALLVAAASLALLLSALQAIQHSSIALFAGTLERHRAMALLAVQPNTFGAALAMYLPGFVLFSLNRVGNRLIQLWFLGVSAALAFALLLTLSRGSWLGLAAGLIAVALLGDRRLLLILAIAAVSYNSWVPEAAIARVESTTQLDSDDAEGDQIAEGSTQMRIEQYKSLPAMMAPRPVFGWGYESFARVFERHGTLKRSKGAHSSYCQLGTEGGIVGLASLLAVVLAVVAAGWRGYRTCEDPFHRWLAMGILGGMVSMAVSMSSGARFEPQKIFVFFWIFAAIVQRETVLAGLRFTAPAGVPSGAGTGVEAAG